MSTDLDKLVADASANITNAPLSRVQVLPYADMQALNQPPDLNQFSNDLVSTLAVLAAQGPVNPVLLGADATGRLRTSTAPASLTTLTAPLAGGAITATVQDSSDFYPGQVVSLVSKDGSVGTCTDVQVNAVPNINTLVFAATCTGHNFSIGDFVVGGGDVRVTQVLVPVLVGGTITMLPPGSPNPGDSATGISGTIGGHKRLMVDKERSCDAIAITVDIQPSAAQVVLPAVASGVANVVKWATFGGNNLTGAAQQFNLEIWDGVFGTGTRKWRGTISFPIGQLVTLHIPDLHIRGSNNTQMSIGYNAGAANMFQDVTVGAYYEGV